MKITLIHVDCLAAEKGASGDFSSAGELAYAIRGFFNSENRCVLTSNTQGIAVLKRLYGNSSSDELEIYDLKILIIDHNKVKAFLENHECERFVMVGCKPLDENTVKGIISSSAQLISVVTANISRELMLQTLEQYSSDQTFLDRCQFFYTGLGKDREGVLTYKGPFAELDHAEYLDVTRQPYGCMYFPAVDEAASFICDYLTVATRSFKSNNYVIIGNFEKALEGVELFANAQEEKIIVNIPEQKSSVVYNEKSTSASSKQVVLKSRVSHKQMRSLYHFAIPFVATAGVSSQIETMAFGKASFYLSLQSNLTFTNAYLDDRDDDFRQLTWAEPLSKDTTDNIVKNLSDAKWCEQVIAQNKKLVEAKDTTAGLRKLFFPDGATHAETKSEVKISHQSAVKQTTAASCCASHEVKADTATGQRLFATSPKQNAAADTSNEPADKAKLEATFQ